jgi:hypothetical protein
MGRRTFAFTKQMLRVFAIYSRHIAKTNKHKQTKVYRHKNTTPYQGNQYKNRQYKKIVNASMVTRGKRSATVEATVEKLSHSC